jgi:hypothetical protein
MRNTELAEYINSQLIAASYSILIELMGYLKKISCLSNANLKSNSCTYLKVILVSGEKLKFSPVE